jgi:hypothetical protein
MHILYAYTIYIHAVWKVLRKNVVSTAIQRARTFGSSEQLVYDIVSHCFGKEK